MAKKRSVFNLSNLTLELVLKNLPFFLFLGFLATVYIASAHYAERNVREIQVMQKELKELRWYYMSLQAENMYNSKRSEIADRVREEGLRSYGQSPKVIVIPEEE